MRYTLIYGALFFSVICINQVNAKTEVEESSKAEQLYDLIANKNTQALTDLQTLAKAKYPQALAELGFIYEYGVSVPTNIERAIKYYTQACDLGGDYGCYNARYFYQYGKGVTQDSDLALKLAKKMKTADLSIPQDLMDKLSDKAYTLKSQADADKSLRPKLIRFLSRYLRQAPDGDLLFWGRIGFSKAELLHMAIQWAQDGDPKMNYLVGTLYLADFSTLDDTYTQEANKEALKWFRIAAEKGDPAAQYTLGDAYEEGLWELKGDRLEAKKWYELAAKNKNTNALIALGHMYYSGRAGQTDYAKANTLFEQAEQAGASRAAYSLSWMYYNGLGKTVDCAKAWDYYLEGAGEYNQRLKKEDYLSRCEKDSQARKNAGNSLPELTLKHDGTPMRGKDAPRICWVNFIITTDKVRDMANLRLTLEFKNSEGVSAEQLVAVPPLGLNTLGIDINNARADVLQQNIELPMYTRDFCRYNDLDVTAKSVTATINGKDVDLLKADSFHILD